MICALSRVRGGTRKHPESRILSKVSKLATLAPILWLVACRQEDPSRTFLNLQDIFPDAKTIGRLETTVEDGQPVFLGQGALSLLLVVPPHASLRLGLKSASGGAPAGTLSVTLAVTLSVTLSITLKADGKADQTYRLAAGNAKTEKRAIDLSDYSGAPLQLILKKTGSATVVLTESRVTVPAGTNFDPRLRDFSLPYIERPPKGAEKPLLQSAPQGAPRSVLIFLLDALRASSLSCYGNQLPASPNLDRLSRQGLLLARNFSQAPNTPPSVKAMLTGRYLPSTGHRTLPKGARTLPELFRKAGFRTAVFSSSPYVSKKFGTTQGFEFVDKVSYVPRPFVYSASPPEKHYADFLSARFLGWLREDHETRFFAYIHAIHPHNPYTPADPWKELFTQSGDCGRFDGSTPTLLAVRSGKIPLDRDAVARHHKLLYLEDLAYADLAIGKLLAGLRKARRDRETLMVVLADHGEEFLEHGGILHGYTAFDEMLHVPVLLARLGSRESGSLHLGLTETIDLFPTIAQAAGLSVPRTVEGRPLGAKTMVYASASSAPGIFSLRTDSTKYIFAPGQTLAEHVYSKADVRRNPKRMVRRGGVRSPGMGEKLGRTHALHYLFDLKRDPGETQNLAPTHPVATEFWHRRLVSWLEKTDRGPAGNHPKMTEDDCAALAALGYIDPDGCP